MNLLKVQALKMPFHLVDQSKGYPIHLDFSAKDFAKKTLVKEVEDCPNVQAAIKAGLIKKLDAKEVKQPEIKEMVREDVNVLVEKPVEEKPKGKKKPKEQK